MPICKINIIWILKYSFLTVLFVTVLSISISSAGNKKMVDEVVKELDKINKKVVGQIPGLPRNGVVAVKAKAFYEEGDIKFKIYEKRVSETEEKTLGFGKKQQKTGKKEEQKDESQQNR